MVYLARGGFWLSMNQGISAILGLILAISFANLISPETYGLYKYYLSILGILTIFTLPGMSTAISCVVAKGDISAIYAATKIKFIYSLLGSLLTFIWSIYYFIHGNPVPGFSLLLISIFLPFFHTFTLYRSYFIGKKRFDMITKYQIFTQIVSTLSLILMLLSTDNIFLILFAYLFPFSLIHLILFFFTIHKHTKNVLDKKKENTIIKDTIIYGKHLSAMNVLNIFAKNIDKFLLLHFLGPVQLATYAFAITIPDQIKNIFKGIGDLALPKFAEKSTQYITKHIRKFWYKLGVMSIVIAILSLLYILVAPYLFKILFPQYIKSVYYSQIYALSTISIIGVAPLTLLTTQNKTKEQYQYMIILPITRLIFFIIFIPLYGIMGAIIAWVLSRIINLMVIIFLTNRVFSQ